MVQLQAQAPVPISLVLCDDVIPDRRSRKFHVIGWADSIRAASFPHAARNFNVFIALTGTQGNLSCQVDCFGPDGQKIFASPARVLVFSRSDQIIVALFRLRGVRFPEAGVYRVRFLCNNHVVTERQIRLMAKGANGDV